MSYSPFSGITDNDNEFDGPEFFDFGRQTIRIDALYLHRSEQTGKWWLRLEGPVETFASNEWSEETNQVGKKGLWQEDISVKWKMQSLRNKFFLPLLQSMQERVPGLQGKGKSELAAMINEKMCERLTGPDTPARGTLIQLNKVKEYSKKGEGPFRREYWSKPSAGPARTAPSELAVEPVSSDDIPF